MSSERSATNRTSVTCHACGQSFAVDIAAQVSRRPCPHCGTNVAIAPWAGVLLPPGATLPPSVPESPPVRPPPTKSGVEAWLPPTLSPETDHAPPTTPRDDDDRSATNPPRILLPSGPDLVGTPVDTLTLAVPQETRTYEQRRTARYEVSKRRFWFLLVVWGCCVILLGIAILAMMS